MPEKVHGCAEKAPLQKEVLEAVRLKVCLYSLCTGSACTAIANGRKGCGCHRQPVCANLSVALGITEQRLITVREQRGRISVSKRFEEIVKSNPPPITHLGSLMLSCHKGKECCAWEVSNTEKKLHQCSKLKGKWTVNSKWTRDYVLKTEELINWYHATKLSHIDNCLHRQSSDQKRNHDVEREQ